MVAVPEVTLEVVPVVPVVVPVVAEVVAAVVLPVPVEEEVVLPDVVEPLDVKQLVSPNYTNYRHVFRQWTQTAYQKIGQGQHRSEPKHPCCHGC